MYSERRVSHGSDMTNAIDIVNDKLRCLISTGKSNSDIT